MLKNVFQLINDFFFYLNAQLNTVYVVLAVLSALVFLINLGANSYAKLNSSTIRSTRMLKRSLKSTLRLSANGIVVPTQYALAWDILGSGNLYPSQVFTFARKKQPVKFLYFVIACTVFCGAVAFTGVSSSGDMTVFIPLFALVSVNLLLLGIVNFLNIAKVNKANNIFNNWVAVMDRYMGNTFFSKQESHFCLDKDVNNAIEQIEMIKSSGINEATAREVASVLNSERLKLHRTPEQQRRLNSALNGLLHMISNKQATQSMQPMPTTLS